MWHLVWISGYLCRLCLFSSSQQLKSCYENFHFLSIFLTICLRKEFLSSFHCSVLVILTHFYTQFWKHVPSVMIRTGLSQQSFFMNAGVGNLQSHQLQNECYIVPWGGVNASFICHGFVYKKGRTHSRWLGCQKSQVNPPLTTRAFTHYSIEIFIKAALTWAQMFR